MIRRHFIIVVALLAVGGCRKQHMAQQAKYEPLEPSGFFADGQSARPLVYGTVPRDGYPVGRQAVYASTSPLTAADVERGHKQFEIFCAPCHGRLGNGQGMIVQRGFPRPPSFYIDRLRNAPDSHFYDVISNGYGAMYSYNERVAPEDRVRIVAYVRALQLSTQQRQ
jgi:mono/diheme cytochrome c family protein